MVLARRESALRRVGSRRIWLVVGGWPSVRGMRNRIMVNAACICRDQEALARCVYSPKTSVTAPRIVLGAATFTARAPRLRRALGCEQKTRCSASRACGCEALALSVRRDGSSALRCSARACRRPGPRPSSPRTATDGRGRSCRCPRSNRGTPSPLRLRRSARRPWGQ